MVRELKQACLSVTTPATKIVFDEAYSSQGEGNSDHCFGQLSTKVNGKIYQLLKQAPKLLKIDSRTESVIRPLENYSNGIAFRPLEEAGLQADDLSKNLILNSNAVSAFAQTVPKDRLHIAVLVYACHEVIHISQNLKRYEDVQRIKGIGLDKGRERMGELDLRSDFLAAHTISLFLTLHEWKVYNPKQYLRWFHEIWCRVGSCMTQAFPSSTRKDKLQRAFGSCLMANLVCDAYGRKHPLLEFNGELWPEWNEALNWLSIYSDGEPFLPGASVNPELMQQILNDLSNGKYDLASSGLRQVWSQLPRR